jgi:hypothetical protein
MVERHASGDRHRSGQLPGAILVSPMANRVGVKMRVTFKKTRWPSQLVERMDRIAADLNVILLVFAVGLATLDLTFMVTQKVVDRLPQVTRLADDAAPAADNSVQAPQK